MTEKSSYISDYTNTTTDTEFTALVEKAPDTASLRTEYPGNRRHVPSVAGPPADHVLIRTAGNALQAIPRAEYDENLQKSNVLAVSVPYSASPGDPLLVRNPHSNKVVQATVPQQAVPGQTIFVQIPVKEEIVPDASVMGAEPLHDLELATVDSESVVGGDFVFVKVPEGYAPGSKLNVQVGEGRSVQALVPDDPSIREFYLNVKDTKKKTLEAYIV